MAGSEGRSGFFHDRLPDPATSGTSIPREESQRGVQDGRGEGTLNQKRSATGAQRRTAPRAKACEAGSCGSNELNCGFRSAAEVAGQERRSRTGRFRKESAARGSERPSRGASLPWFQPAGALRSIDPSRQKWPWRGATENGLSVETAGEVRAVHAGSEQAVFAGHLEPFSFWRALGTGDRAYRARLPAGRPAACDAM